MLGPCWQKLFALNCLASDHSAICPATLSQPTGKRVEWAGAAVFTFAGEQISALWVLGDIHGLLQQLANNACP